MQGNFKNAKPVVYLGVYYPSRRRFLKALFGDDPAAIKNADARMARGWPADAIAHGFLVVTCKHCGAEFEGEKIARFYCSPKCWAADNPRRRTEKTRAQENLAARKIYHSDLEAARRKGLARYHAVSSDPDLAARRSETIRASRARDREQLHDRYILKLLTGGRAKSASIPPALIELKREQLKLTRLIKEKENA